MKTIIFSVLFTAMLVANSCNKDCAEPEIQGRYIGTFNQQEHGIREVFTSMNSSHLEPYSESLTKTDTLTVEKLSCDSFRIENLPGFQREFAYKDASDTLRVSYTDHYYSSSTLSIVFDPKNEGLSVFYNSHWGSFDRFSDVAFEFAGKRQ